MPIDIFEQIGLIKKSEPKDLFVEAGIKPENLESEHGIIPAIKAGIAGSATGLALRALTGKKGLPVPYKPAGFGEELAMIAGQLVPDIPIMIGGGIAGTAVPVAGTMAGAFAAPEIVRQAAIEKLEPEATSIGNAALQIAKAATIGKLTGIAGKVAKFTLPTGIISKIGVPAAEIGTMATTGTALEEGRLPTAKELALTGIPLGALHIATAGAGKVLRSKPKGITEVIPEIDVTKKPPPEALSDITSEIKSPVETMAEKEISDFWDTELGKLERLRQSPEGRELLKQQLSEESISDIAKELKTKNPQLSDMEISDLIKNITFPDIKEIPIKLSETIENTVKDALKKEVPSKEQLERLKEYYESKRVKLTTPEISIKQPKPELDRKAIRQKIIDNRLAGRDTFEGITEPEIKFVQQEALKEREVKPVSEERRTELENKLINAIDADEATELIMEGKNIKTHLSDALEAGKNYEETKNDLRELLISKLSEDKTLTTAEKGRIEAKLDQQLADAYEKFIRKPVPKESYFQDLADRLKAGDKEAIPELEKAVEIYGRDVTADRVGNKIVTKTEGFKTLESDYNRIVFKREIKPEVVAPIIHEEEPITKTETKEIFKEAGIRIKEEGLSLVQQKEYLLAEISKAIKTAPVIEEKPINIEKARTRLADLIAYRDAILKKPNSREGKILESVNNDIETLQKLIKGETVDYETYKPVETITIEVPGDGTFEIFNTKDALTEFRRLVDVHFPEKEISKRKTKAIKTFRPTASRAKGLPNKDLIRLKYKGDDWHTNGEILLKGTPKIRPTGKTEYEGRYKETPPKVENVLIEQPLDIKKIDFFYKYYENESVSDKPIPDENARVLLTSSTDNWAVLQQKNYNYIKAHYPDAIFKLSDTDSQISSISILSGNKLIGMVMPIIAPKPTSIEEVIKPETENKPVLEPFSEGSRVRFTGSPQDYTISKALKSTPEEAELGEQYFEIKNNRTGEIETVERGDLRPIKAVAKAEIKPQIYRITEPTVVTSVKGKKTILPKGEEYFAYPKGKDKYLLKDGKQVTVYEGELEKLKGQILPEGEQPKAGGVFHESKTITGNENKFSDIASTIESINNPKLRAGLETMWQKTNDAKNLITGEKGILGKLISIPYRMAQRFEEFRPVFETVQNGTYRANELKENAKEIFTDKTVKTVKGSAKIGNDLFTGQERIVKAFQLTVEGAKELGIITEAEAKDFNNILEKVPRKKGMTVKNTEYLDKNVYEGLLDIASKLGIKHTRVISAGRGKLGFAKEIPPSVVTQYATELSVLAHEIGHHLDYRFNLWDKIVESAEGIGKRGKVTEQATKKLKAEIGNELRALADLTWEGIEGVTPYYKAKVRKRSEKMAHLLEAYIHAPERFKETAPKVYESFNKFIDETPELGLLPDIKQGLALVKNEIYRSGQLGKVLEDMIKSKEYTEEQAMNYLKVRELLNEKKRAKTEWGTDKAEEIEQQGWEYSGQELKDMKYSEEESEAYRKARQAVDLDSNLFIEKLKERFGYYDADTTPLQRKVMDIETNEAVKKFGAYMKIMRFGDHWIEYIKDEERHVSSFESLYEKNHAKIQLQKEEGISNIKDIDMADVRERKRLFPYLSLNQLDALLDKAEISKNKGEIKELRDILKERIGNAALIKRQWIPGYERTGEHAVKTIETGIEQSVKGYIKAKINREANQRIGDIENTKLMIYAQRYLENFNSGVQDAEIFRGIRQLVATMYLSSKPSFFLQNIFSTLRTYNRLSKDAGFFKGGKIWGEAQEKIGQYLAYKTADLAGKKIKIDPDYLKAMEQLRIDGDLQANYMQQLFGTREGIKTKEGVQKTKNTVLKLLNVLGSSADIYTREHAASAGWLVAKNKGLDFNATTKLMKDYIHDTQTVYTGYNIPVFIGEMDKALKGGARTAYLFNQYSWDWIQQMSSYLRGALKGKEKVANLRGVISSTLTLGAMAGLKGIPLAFLTASVYSLATGDDLWQKIRIAIGKEHKGLSDAAIYGVVSKMTATDFSGLLGLGRWPLGIEIGKKEALPIDIAVEGLIERGQRAYKFYQKDDMWRTAAEIAPDAVRNLMTGERWEEEKVIRTIGGEAITTGGKTFEPTEEEIRRKQLSFQPLRLSKAYEERQAKVRISQKLKEKRSYFYNKIVEAKLSDDIERIRKVYLELRDYNKERPLQERIRLDTNTISRKIREARRGRTIQRTPKQLRGQEREIERFY